MSYRSLRALLVLVFLVIICAPMGAIAAPPAPVAASDPGQADSLTSAVDSTAAPAGTTLAATKVYIVQRGDTLTRIAKRFGVSVSALMKANNLRNPNFVYVGQRLIIPSGGTTNPSPKPAPAPVPAPNPAPVTGRWIDVSLGKQLLTAYEGQTPVFTTPISSGTSAHPTVVGRYRIYTKLAAQAMSGPGYYLPNVPYVMYFYKGYAIHGTYWHHNFGHPMSHGCVNASTPAAAWLYGWASVGTLVVTHY